MGHQWQQQNNDLIAKIVCEKKMRIIAKKKKTQHKLTTLTSCCYLRARGG
jgi:hypothetical protein